MAFTDRPRVLFVVVKSSSALDYTLPVLWGLKRKYPKASVSVMYCSLTRGNILRKSIFYSAVLKSLEITEYDFMDFTDGSIRFARKLIAKVISSSPRDTPEWTIGNDNSSPIVPLKSLWRRVQRVIERAMRSRINHDLVWEHFDPDIVLMENRWTTAFEGRSHLFEFLNRKRPFVAMVPHAPHHVDQVAFTRFDECGEELPDFCDFWMPFRYEESWRAVNDGKRDQFGYVGYPGLDGAWLKWLTEQWHSKLSGSVKTRGSAPLRCMIVTRRFTDPGSEPPDSFVLPYSEFKNFVSIVGQALSTVEQTFEIIVKPHPSNDFGLLSRLFVDSGIENWTVTHDSIYAAAMDVDLVISTYSTAQFIPAMIGVPTLTLNSSTQRTVDEAPHMKELYRGFKFFLERPEDITSALPEALALVHLRRQGGLQESPDFSHIRAYYPDGAIGRAINRMQKQLTLSD